MGKKAVVALCLALAAPAWAEGEAQSFVLGSDVYLGGQTVTLTEAGRDDAFLAGNSVRLQAALAGSAYMAGRFVEIGKDIGGSLFAVAQRITVEAAIAGDAMLAAQAIEVAAPVAGDLRIVASEIEVSAPVGDTLIAFGEIVELNAPVIGDAAISARELRFGTDAAIGGTLILYEDVPGTLEVPERVLPADRITRIDADGRPAGTEVFTKPKVQADSGGVSSGAARFLLGVVVVAALAAAFAVLAPTYMGRLRGHVLGRPGRALLVGFAGLSTLLGGTILLALTLVGLLVAPLVVIATMLACVAGYVIAAYALGAKILSLFGGGMPDDTSDRAIAAAIGALSAGLIGLIPVIGYLAILLLVLVGVGALVQQLVRPMLFAPE